MLAGLSILLLLPFVVYRIAKQMHPSQTWTATGLSFGLVVAPASLGLYALYFISYLGFVPGMIGLVSSLFHGSPGFEVATALGLRDPGAVVNGQEAIIIDVINGLFWGIVYGALEHLIDRRRGIGTSARS
jgi:hypothetical protein